MTEVIDCDRFMLIIAQTSPRPWTPPNENRGQELESKSSTDRMRNDCSLQLPDRHPHPQAVVAHPGMRGDAWSVHVFMGAQSWDQPWQSSSLMSCASTTASNFDGDSSARDGHPLNSTSQARNSAKSGTQTTVPFRFPLHVTRWSIGLPTSTTVFPRAH